MLLKLVMNRFMKNIVMRILFVYGAIVTGLLILSMPVLFAYYLIDKGLL